MYVCCVCFATQVSFGQSIEVRSFSIDTLELSKKNCDYPISWCEFSFKPMIPNQYCAVSDYDHHGDGSGNHNSGCDANQACKRVERVPPNRGTYYYQCGAMPSNSSFSAILAVDLNLPSPHHYDIWYSIDGGASFISIGTAFPLPNSSQIEYIETNSSVFSYYSDNINLVYKFNIYNSVNTLLETVIYQTQPM